LPVTPQDIGANMIGMGPYITEPNTPVAEMWEALYGNVDKKAHMRSMFELTTRWVPHTRFLPLCIVRLPSLHQPSCFV